MITDLIDYKSSHKDLISALEKMGIDTGLVMNPDLTLSQLQVITNCLLHGIDYSEYGYPIEWHTYTSLVRFGKSSYWDKPGSDYSYYYPILEANGIHDHRELIKPEQAFVTLYPKVYTFGYEHNLVKWFDYKNIDDNQEAYDVNLAAMCLYTDVADSYLKKKTRFFLEDVLLDPDEDPVNTDINRTIVQWYYAKYDFVKNREWGFVKECIEAEDGLDRITQATLMDEELLIRGKLDITVDEKYSLKQRDTIWKVYSNTGIDLRLHKELHNFIHTPSNQLDVFNMLSTDEYTLYREMTHLKQKEAETYKPKFFDKFKDFIGMGR